MEKHEKLTSIPLAMAVLASVTAIPALADTTLLTWSGSEVKLTDSSVRDGDDNDSSIRLNVRAINNSDHPNWLHAEDIMVDSTDVYCAGVTGIKVGMDKTDFILIKPDDANPVWGDGAIRTGSTIDMTLILDDDETFEELYRQDMRIDLYGLSVSVGGYDNGADFGHGGAYANTAPRPTPRHPMISRPFRRAARVRPCAICSRGLLRTWAT